MLGIIYRAFKESQQSDSDRERNASLLRNRGQFLEAERSVQLFDRSLKVVCGGLTIKAGDWLCTNLISTSVIRTENDARFFYIFDKIFKSDALLVEGMSSDIDLLPKYLEAATGLLNQAFKAALIYPPFKENNNSSLCRRLETTPVYMQEFLGFILADLHGRLKSLEFIFSRDFIALCQGSVDVYNLVLEHPAFDSETKQRAEAGRDILRKRKRIFSDCVQLLSSELLPPAVDNQRSGGLFTWPWEIVKWEAFKRNNYASLPVDTDFGPWPEIKSVQTQISKELRAITEEPFPDPEIQSEIRLYFDYRREMLCKNTPLSEMLPIVANVFQAA